MHGSDITKCTDGNLVQYAYHYECQCHTNYVHAKKDVCVKDDTLVKCGALDTIGKTCGDFAVCVKNDKKDKAKADATPEAVCQCIEDYSTSEINTESLNNCKPKVCEGITCNNGICIKNTDTASICSCYIGFIHDSKKECADKPVEKQKCTLKCGTNEECVLHENKYYQCICADGNDPIDGVCGSAFRSTLSATNAILLLVVLIISLKWS